MAPPQIDLRELQNVVGQYVDQHGIVMAAGPLGAATIVRTFISKSKIASIGVVASGAWLAVHTVSSPILSLIQEQFGYLQSLIGN